jgi:hypothetical protein
VKGVVNGIYLNGIWRQNLDRHNVCIMVTFFIRFVEVVTGAGTTLPLDPEIAIARQKRHGSKLDKEDLCIHHLLYIMYNNI